MPYDRIPGISAVLRDGGLLTPRATTQPRIIILGSAPSGDSYRMFTVTELNEAKNEFTDRSVTSEMIKKAYEVFAEGGENIALMRIGGTKGFITIIDPTSGATLTITPELRDDTVLTRYALIIQLNAEGDLQILIWDHDDEDWAYDSDGILNSDNTEFDIEVSGAWDSGTLIGNINYPSDKTKTPTLRRVSGENAMGVRVDYTDALSLIVIAEGTSTTEDGKDGTNMSFVERYAALEEAYQFLDYRDGDMIIPCGVYLDAPNIAERDDGSHHESGTGSAVYSPNYASVPTAGDPDHDVLGWLWQYLYRGKVYSYFLDNKDPSAATHVLDHLELTGEAIPTAVSTKFTAAVEAEVRECNFGHQLASFCYRSSTAWKTMLGFISVTPPDIIRGFGSRMLSRAKVRAWAGDIPTFSSFGEKEGIDSPSDNGNGVLGLKFLGGTSGYRYAGLDGYGDAQDGLAYGGMVMTRGASLPNQGDWVYGISTEDELNDSAGFPVDIGRHMFITYDYPRHNNDFSGAYRGTMEASIAGKLASIPENQEPIGPVNGQVASLSNPLSMTASLTNEFAEVRAVGLMTDERTGSARSIIVTCRTAAHPDSDYTRVSTIRCVNREIQGIRNIAMPYIGQSFSSTTLVSLQQAIDGFLKGERSLGFNQGAIARLSYTREDRIMGRLTVTLRMVPPFALEAITIQVSLAAEEAEL